MKGEAYKTMAVGFKRRLEEALERAASAESALRSLVDECENDSVLGWENRMIDCINHANSVLSAQGK